MRGLLLTLVTALMVTGSASASDMFYSNTRTTGDLGSSELQVQVHCENDGGPTEGLAPEIEVFLDGVQVTPTALGDDAAHGSERGFVGDVVADGETDDGEYDCEAANTFTTFGLLPVVLITAIDAAELVLDGARDPTTLLP